MRHLASIFAVLFFVTTSALAFADSLDTLTLSGDGQSFQFTVPSTQTVTDNPHIVDVSFSNAPGSVDGVGGYIFGGAVATNSSGSIPLLLLLVSPLPPGVTPSPIYGSDYMLYGPAITTLIADVPNPDPFGGPFPDDLLTFAYVPGTYSLYGYDPEHNPPGYYTLQITEAAATGTTPEPGTWLLMLTGIVGLALASQRQQRTGPC